MRQLAGLEDYGQPPVHQTPREPLGEYETTHIPKMSSMKRNCKVCYSKSQIALKVRTYCDAPQWQVYLHLTQEKDCFEVWHSKNYPHH